MLSLQKHFGRLVTLVLLVLFIWRVALSGKMLLDKKISTSVSNIYSKFRLYPSLSICVALKNVVREELLDDVSSNLEKLLNEVLISFWHTTISESG